MREVGAGDEERPFIQELLQRSGGLHEMFRVKLSAHHADDRNLGREAILDQGQLDLVAVFPLVSARLRDDERQFAQVSYEGCVHG